MGNGVYKPIVDSVVRHFAAELWDAIGELNEAAKVGKGQASFTATFSIKKAKKGRIAGTLAARVRAPREPIEIDLHFDEDGQLSLGLPDTPDEIEGEVPDDESEDDRAEAHEH